MEFDPNKLDDINIINININRNNDKKMRDTIKGYIEEKNDTPSSELEYITD